MYNTILPFLLMGFLPRCFVPPSYALIGLPFATIGFVLALLGQESFDIYWRCALLCGF